MSELLGRLVYSNAGRDKGRPFVVIDVLDSQYALIVDGSLRKIESPKRKKTKHLVITTIIFNELIEKLDKKIQINNKEIKKILEVVKGNV